MTPQLTIIIFSSIIIIIIIIIIRERQYGILSNNKQHAASHAVVGELVDDSTSTEVGVTCCHVDVMIPYSYILHDDNYHHHINMTTSW